MGGTFEEIVRSSPEARLRQPAAAPATVIPPPAALPSEDPGRAVEEASGPARVFAVASGKGGTGKSLLAVNLAVALAERLRVCLIDADLSLANAHILLGIIPRHDAADLLAGDIGLDDVVVEGPRGLLLLPGTSGVPEMSSLDEESLARFVDAMAPLFARCDAAILDCPAGLTRQGLLLLHGADVVIVVTTDDLTAMTDAYALLKTLLAHRPQASLGLVVNEARSVADGSETYRKVGHVARKFLGREIPLLGIIPRDPLLERSVTERRPVLLGHPLSPGARAIEDLADRVWSLREIEPRLGFPERLRRTLAAASSRLTDPRRNGERPCAS